MQSIKGIIFALIAAATYGLIPLFAIPLMTHSSMGLPSILFYRFLFSAILIGSICLFKKNSFKISLQNLVIAVILAVLQATTSLCLIYSYKLIPSGISTTIHFLYPIVVSFLLVVFFKEKKSAILILAAVLSMLGVGLLCWQDGYNINLLGVAIAGFTVVTYSCFMIIVNKTSASKVNAEVLTFYILLAAAIIYFIYTSSTEGIENIPDISAWINLTLLAFLPTVVAGVALVLAIKYAGSTITAILGSIEPVVAVIVGIFHFSEDFSSNSFWGLMLILASVIIVIIFDKESKSFDKKSDD